jgi:hypothetical protein
MTAASRGAAVRAAGARPALGELPGDEGVDPIDRLRRDAPAEAQAGNQLAVVDDTAPESALGHAYALAEGRDLGEELVIARAPGVQGEGRLWRRVIHRPGLPVFAWASSY